MLQPRLPLQDIGYLANLPARQARQRDLVDLVEQPDRRNGNVKGMSADCNPGVTDQCIGTVGAKPRASIDQMPYIGPENGAVGMHLIKVCGLLFKLVFHVINCLHPTSGNMNQIRAHGEAMIVRQICRVTPGLISIKAPPKAAPTKSSNTSAMLTTKEAMG